MFPRSSYPLLHFPSSPSVGQSHISFSFSFSFSYFCFFCYACFCFSFCALSSLVQRGCTMSQTRRTTWTMIGHQYISSCRWYVCVGVGADQPCRSAVWSWFVYTRLWRVRLVRAPAAASVCGGLLSVRCLFVSNCLLPAALNSCGAARALSFCFCRLIYPLWTCCAGISA